MDDELDTSEPIDVPSLPFEGSTLVFFTTLAILPALLSVLASKIILALRNRENYEPPSGLQQTPTSNLNGGIHSNIPSTPRYGLALGETLSADDDSDTEIEDDVTSRELRRLQQSPSFHTFLRSRKLTGRDLESIYSRLRLYKRLKTLHPASFWMLCSTHSLIYFQSIEPGFFTLILEYFLSSCINCAAFSALAWCIWTTATSVYWISCTIALWSWCIHSWLHGRPSAGPLISGWYEDTTWGHGVPAARAALASILETVYLLGTVGSGAVVSLPMRWKTGQSVGEKIVGVKLVLERKVRVGG